MPNKFAKLEKKEDFLSTCLFGNGITSSFESSARVTVKSGTSNATFPGNEFEVFVSFDEGGKRIGASEMIDLTPKLSEDLLDVLLFSLSEYLDVLGLEKSTSERSEDDLGIARTDAGLNDGACTCDWCELIESVRCKSSIELRSLFP